MNLNNDPFMRFLFYTWCAGSMVAMLVDGFVPKQFYYAHSELFLIGTLISGGLVSWWLLRRQKRQDIEKEASRGFVDSGDGI